MPQCLTPGMEDWFGKEERGREGAGRGRRYELRRGRREGGMERRKKERKKESKLSSMMTEGKPGRGENRQGTGESLHFFFRRISGYVKIARTIWIEKNTVTFSRQNVL